MDKHSYIERYPSADRCLDGRIPLRGTEMDESSGSSGTPFNWLRSHGELHEVHLQLSKFARQVIGPEIVTINGFSMGAWSTGVNTAEALKRNGLVKSPGPDLEKIISTLRYLGPGYTYAITGYPPFLREILEYGTAEGLDWRQYLLYGVVGGEGMSEALRARLLKSFAAVFSAYGASDLDIGVAAETPTSIWVRQQADRNPALRQALFGDDSRLPMLFQYNPLDYMVETVNGELVITVNRLCMLSPRIRYNIHDSGSSHSYQTVVEICRGFGIDIETSPVATASPRFRLPFLYIQGRSDSTISYMGSNIYPEDIEQGLSTVAEYNDQIRGFALELREIGDGAVRPCVHVEFSDDASLEVETRLRTAIVERLLTNSRDFRAAAAENPTATEFLIEVHRPGTGPFEENSRRIKRRYILRGPRAID